MGTSGCPFSCLLLGVVKLELLSWLPTAAVSALAFVLWKMGNRVIDKLEALESLMKTELRTMDVRLTRIEVHLWPSEPRR